MNDARANGGGGPEANAYPHQAWQEALARYYRALTLPRQQRPNLTELLESLAAYVAAHDDEGTFMDEWAQLSQTVERAGGISATGLNGVREETVRIKRLQILVAGARRAHILENGEAHASPQSLEEKRRRLATTPREVRP